MRRRNNAKAFPLRGKVAEGRMRGRFADIEPQKGNKASLPLISPLRGQLLPREKPFDVKRGRFCVLFFTYTHIFGVPTQ